MSNINEYEFYSSTLWVQRNAISISLHIIVFDEKIGFKYYTLILLHFDTPSQFNSFQIRVITMKKINDLPKQMPTLVSSFDLAFCS